MASPQLTDLPPEILETIFSYLQLNLQSLLELAMVCRRFRDVVYRVPVPVKIPLQDWPLHVMRHHHIPALSLCNREPSLFVKYQFGQLNLRRLTSAQLVADDYLAKTNRVELSPHYLEILEHLARFSHKTLRFGHLSMCPPRQPVFQSVVFGLALYAADRIAAANPWSQFGADPDPFSCVQPKKSEATVHLCLSHAKARHPLRFPRETVHLQVRICQHQRTQNPQPQEPHVSQRTGGIFP